MTEDFDNLISTLRNKRDREDRNNILERIRSKQSNSSGDIVIETIVESYEIKTSTDYRDNKPIPRKKVEVKEEDNDLVGIITYGPCAMAKRGQGGYIPEVMMTIPRKSGIYRQCTVAECAQNTGEKGFARLKYQIFHGSILEKLGCPFYKSRNILYRIPFLSWLFVKTDICPYAEGKEKLKSR